MSAWPRPTARGIGLLAASALLFWLAPTLGQRDIVFGASVALALPLLALVFVRVRTPKLTVVRRFTPETASAGSECDVTLAVQNWSMAATPAATWSDGIDSPASHELPSLPAFRPLETDAPRVHVAHYRLRPQQRGVRPIGPFVVTLSDPFGLAVRRIVIGSTNDLVVTPAVDVLSRESFRLPNGDGGSQQSRRPTGAGEQDVIARKYQTGDSMRRVHWPATARHSELMVRQDDQHNDHEAVVVLDDRLGSYGSSSGRGTGARSSAGFEWAVSLASSIGLHLIDEGYRTRFVSASVDSRGQARDEAVTSAAQLLLSAALVTLVDDDAPYSIRSILADSGRAAGELPPLFVVVGDLDDESVSSLRRAAAGASSAVAFVVVPDQTAAPTWAASLHDALVSAGWFVVICDVRSSMSEAWESVGRSRVFQ